MSLLWSWLAFNAGFLAGCAWVASRFSVERNAWTELCRTWERLADESLRREARAIRRAQAAVRLLEHATKPRDPGGVPWEKIGL